MRCFATCDVFENLSVTTIYNGTLAFKNNEITATLLELKGIYELTFNDHKYQFKSTIENFIENYKTAFDIDIYENEDVKLITQKVLSLETIQDKIKDVTLTSLINSDTMTVNK